MASEVDQQIERAREVMARIAADQEARGAGHRAPRRRGGRGGRIGAAILAAAVVLGLIAGLGTAGWAILLAVAVAAMLLVAFAPRERVPSERSLREVDLKVLPARTGRWLAAQRSALPASARSVATRIGDRLDALSPQLDRAERDPEAAAELRRLIGEQLPAFVADYSRVPETLRSVERNGRTPDAELVAGLTLIEREIADMTERLAQPDLDNLQTRGRYLEIKYRDEADPETM